MEHIIFISEVLNDGQGGDAAAEVVATADAIYDSGAQKVAVELGVFARRVAVSGDGENLSMPWLPHAERVVEHLARDEAADFAKDVFRSWVKKVRDLIPQKVVA